MRHVISWLLILLYPCGVTAEILTGKVVKITDGDTLVILDASLTQHKVRLAGIDAPEAKQAFGQKSKERLSQVVAGQQVEVDWDKRDRYQRIVGKVIFNGNDVNLAQIRAGLAWWYRKYANEQTQADRALYETGENQAKAERRGLWADPAPLPPWEFRHQPAPATGNAAHCQCAMSKTCTGPRGGVFCITDSGAKRYVAGN
jgi:endonuclease YncB( thermonuclease family)